MIYILAFITSYINIALRAFQQKNVMNDKYMWVMPTSMSMAVCEVIIISQAASQGMGWIALPIGLGSGLGCLTSMKIHNILSGLKNGKTTEK